MKILLPACRLLLVLTVLTGVAYPFVVWAAGQTLAPGAARGSLLRRDGRVVGSALLAQPPAGPRYFAPRPSAGDYATVASAASNQAWTSAALASAVARRRAAWGGGDDVPAELLTASGSGLDPHLSPEAVAFQAGRVAAARGLDAAGRAALHELIARHTEGGQLGPNRVNVLQLNLALDEAFPER